MNEKELKKGRVKEIFDDAYSLYQEAIGELERGNIRESAEKSLGSYSESYQGFDTSKDR